MAALLCVVLSACFASHEAADVPARDAGPASDAPLTDASPPADAGHDAGPTRCAPDETLGLACRVDSDCDDGCFCTSPAVCAAGRCERGTARVCPEDTTCSRSSCDEATDTCQATSDDAICDDHEACNGVEWCLPFGGCRAGVPPPCDDGNPCTFDACTPGGRGCVHAPRDLDGDGFGPTDCGGTDCDDGSATVHPGAADVCDGVDEDCAQDWDYDAPGCVAGFDTCATAGEIRSDLIAADYEGTTIASADDYVLSCGGGGADAVFHLSNPALRTYDLQVTFVGVHATDPMEPVAIAVRPWAACIAGPDERCAAGPTWGGMLIGWQPSARMPIGLAAGEWAIIVEGPLPSSYVLRVTY